ncbi:MAG: DNA methyltransferase [Treponema sp.]
MMTKEDIHRLRMKNDTSLASLINENLSNAGNLIFILENLGHIQKDFNYSWLLELLDYNNETIRVLVLKNLGKVKSTNLIQVFYNVVNSDESTLVKREAVSALGRLRNDQTKDILLELLDDSDPKIVCQAIRGLLIFKGESKIDKVLKQLINHENEMVKAVIKKEYFSIKKKSSNTLKHPETYSFLKNVIVNADVLETLKYVPDESIHLTFTSPPYYNARDYSIYPSYEAYLQFLGNVFKETHRITKEGRFLIVNTSPVIVPRISRSHSSKRYPIPFDLHSILVKQGWEFIDDIVWEKPEYSVKNRVGGFQQHHKPLGYKPNSITEYVMVYRKQTDKLLDWNIHQYDYETVEKSKVKGEFETNNIWKICPKSDKIHPAVFPSELCKRVIEYYSYVGDLIFDPFAGSGTLGYTAKKMDRLFFLTEKDEKYFEYMRSYKRDISDNLSENTKFFNLEQFKETIK